MAMKEFKSKTVAPGTEEAEISIWQSFGWELVGAPQEVRTSDSQRLTGRDEDYEYYETIKGVHYIKLSFERNPERPHYEELKSLETQYYSIKNPYCPDAPRFITFLWLILIVLGLAAYVIPGVILLILHIISHIKKSKKWNEDFSKYQQELNLVNSQRKEILSKAQALV